MASDPPLLGSSTGGSSCCGRHHLLWRGLLIAFAVMISVLLMTLCIIRRENGGGHSGNDTKKICLTPGCVFAANEVLRHMKPEVNPCNNFYEFACGHFINETIIPDDKTSVTALDLIDDKLTDQLRMIIEERVRVNETRPLRMAKKLYNSCMNQTRIEEIGLSHMQKMMKRLGGWPVLEGVQWNSTLFTWSNTTYKLRDEGFSIDSLIKLSVEPDSKNSTKRVIVLDQASLSLSLENLEKDKYLVEKLHSYMVDVAVMFRANPDRAYTELNESLEFQIKLANISLRPEERRNSTELYNPMTILELQKKFPSIPWYEYISAILPKSVQVQLNETVIVAVPSYISGLEVLLRITPKRVQANYLLWRAVESVVSHLTASLRERQLQYYKTLSGLTESGPRWKHCVHLSADRFVLPVGALYVKRFFKPEAKKNVLEMVDNLREEMYRILQTVDWMDNNTRKNALMKAKSMVSYIAYPDELLDVSKVEDYYRKLEISGGNFLKAVLNFSKFHLDTMLSELHQPINKTGWIQHATPAMVNAFYNPSENSIMFPAGILQGNVYSFDRPNYMNYAALGFVIGHEITHGFDDEGSQYDQDGDLVDWWAPETRNTYLKKAQCIIDQYSNYTSEQVGLKLNGVNTQGENIADNGGIKQAYRAYNRWVQTHGEEKRLPGLQDFTPQQMFWVSAANTWCSKYRPETLKQIILQSVHSPDEFRVRGPLSNRPEFAKDFNCPLGSIMNPVQKCQVW